MKSTQNFNEPQIKDKFVSEITEKRTKNGKIESFLFGIFIRIYRFYLAFRLLLSALIYYMTV
jgi:hypothetical protein